MTAGSQLAKGIVILLIGAGIAGGGVYLYQDAQAATENAVAVDATVVSSAIEDKRVQDDTGSHTAYYAVVEYRYTYDGSTYTSTNLCPGSGSACEAAQSDPDRDEIESFVSKYPDGEETTAYVAPNEPSAAYLVDRSSASNSYFILMGLGGLVALLGLVGVGNGLKDLVSG